MNSLRLMKNHAQHNKFSNMLQLYFTKAFLFILIIFSSFLFFSCKDRKKADAKEVVREWVNKEIKFPENITTCKSAEKDTLCPDLFDKPYKILIYTDSIGCISCKLRLPDWKEIISETESIAPGKVSFLFFFHPQSEKELTYLFKRDKFDYPVFIDRKNEIEQLNHFPSNINYQTFLLNAENQVILVGNPTLNPAIWELFQQTITGKKKHNNHMPTTMIQIEQNSVELNHLKTGEISHAKFKMKNAGDQSLVIKDIKASCGCTVPKWEKRPIKPGEETLIEVEVTPENSGYFQKSINVFCNTDEGLVMFNITGMVEE